MDKEKFKEGFFHIFKAAGYSLAGLATGHVELELAGFVGFKTLLQPIST